MAEIYNNDCSHIIGKLNSIDLTFLDPPFNQNKDYKEYDDDIPSNEYWKAIQGVCADIFKATNKGGSIYFMQREKNVEHVMRVLRETGWTFQNLIIWRKKTSAVPSKIRFGKFYQIIAYCSKGKPKTFNRLRIDPPLLKNEKYERENGIYCQDVWDDIRELTSGFYAGKEPILDDKGERFHKQQSPIALLLRIILSSSNPGDLVLDPFCGTGTTLVVAEQLKRRSIGIEIDPKNVEAIKNRLGKTREEDLIEKHRECYHCTEGLDNIWGT